MAKKILSKKALDIGYFTNDLEETLLFWRQEIGLAFEEPVRFNDGLTQYRHRLRNTIVKINTSQNELRDPPSGYGEVLIAWENIERPRSLTDPDGNLVTLVPKGHLGIVDTAIKISVRELDKQNRFYLNVMGFEQVGDNSFRSGDCILFTEETEQSEPSGHWINYGFRYITLHVHDVEHTFWELVSDGAKIGERPYAIRDIAKISFIRDPFGNWIEVAQRTSLTGKWK